jgi:hypothetical protein
MNTLTIPKKLIQNDDLVVIPRKKYEKLLRFFEKKSPIKLDKDLREAIHEARNGKAIGSFKTTRALKTSLEK